MEINIVATQSREQMAEQIKRILFGLTEPERKLLNTVLKLEQENLYLEKPQVRQDIIAEIRKVIV
jgi:small-conductance mechanosensitive channel